MRHRILMVQGEIVAIPQEVHLSMVRFYFADVCSDLAISLPDFLVTSPKVGNPPSIWGFA